MTTSYSRTWTPSWPLVPRVQRSRTAPRVPGIPSGIVDSGQKSRVAATRQGAALLGRDDANLGLLVAPANCRQIQHWTTDLVRRIIREHRNPNWSGPGRLVQVALAAELTFELAWLEYPATPGRERRLKNQGSAYRRCPLCRGTGGPLDPVAAAAAALQAGGAR